jgi:dTMP kinase
MSKKKLQKKASAKKPKFIALEGGEGSRKSSIIIALKEFFDDRIITTREPGGSPFAEVIRNAALKDPLAADALSPTMLCLMFASRFEHVAKTVIPAMEKGISVVTDRFDGSSFAYNVHAQSGGELSEVFWHLRNQLSAVPDLYIYIDVSSEEGLRRAHSRNQSLLDGNHFDDRAIDFHNSVRDGYKKFFKQKGVKSIIVDGHQPLAKVQKDVLDIVKKVIV